MGERIGAAVVRSFPEGDHPQASLHAASASEVALHPESLDGVFTDPPYFDNVQYAELMDFCFVWLRLGLGQEFREFRAATTRAAGELTGNVTLGRGLEQFASGLSEVFRHYAGALKPGAPFVFTYHHNDADAYVPVVVAVLDAQLGCTAVLPAAAEMGASLHIARTGSSVLDSVFVCRANGPGGGDHDIEAAVAWDVAAMERAGVRIRQGDIRCLRAGHVARVAIDLLRDEWDSEAPLDSRMAQARHCVAAVGSAVGVGRPMLQIGEGGRDSQSPGEVGRAATV